MSGNFYKAFEEKYRGPRESILLRLKSAYLPFVEILKKFEENSKTIDLGCGRGEWLELMGEVGFSAHGVDFDKEMIKVCLERGLSVEYGDAIDYLTALPNYSQVIVSAFHVVEHISFDKVHVLVSEALRVLKPSGLLILETPNPENIIVATRNFYLDPTHQRPIPPELLSFLPEYYGFYRTKILRLQESKDIVTKESINLNDVFLGASQDYSIIAQKAAPAETLKLFDNTFNKEYGITLDSIALRYDTIRNDKDKKNEAKAKKAKSIAQEALAKARYVEEKAKEAETRTMQSEEKIKSVEKETQEAGERAEKAEVKAKKAKSIAQEALAKARYAEEKAKEAETRTMQAEAALAAIYSSRSWRITAPIRWTGVVVRWFVRGSIAWLTFASQSRPRRILRNVIITMKSEISSRPALKNLAKRFLSFFPQIDVKLRSIASPYPKKIQLMPNSIDDIDEVRNLSPRVRQIYFDLKTAIEQHQKEQS